MKSLLESGVHFGHQTKRWDPRMKKYIFAERNGIHIIDLQKTIAAIKEAYEAVRQTVLAGKSVLFVGTKKQAQQAVQEEAQRCGMFYVNNRWLGGMLTNFTTIKKSLLRLKKLEKMEVDGSFENLTKKEVSQLNKEKTRLEKNLGGIKEMKDLPGVVFVIDTRKEAIAVAEAQRMALPIVAVVDTNCNPDGITYPIPGNDDAIRAITLFTQIIANSVIDAENEVGLEVIETLQDDEEAALVEAGAAAPAEAAVAPRAAEVETVPVAAVVGEGTAAEAPGFTAEDYSNYTPEEQEKRKDMPAASSEVLLEKNVEDEDKLYDE
jgi:small subunit ribosomal protein S2